MRRRLCAVHAKRPQGGRPSRQAVTGAPPETYPSHPIRVILASILSESSYPIHPIRAIITLQAAGAPGAAVQMK